MKAVLICAALAVLAATASAVNVCVFEQTSTLGIPEIVNMTGALFDPEEGVTISGRAYRPFKFSPCEPAVFPDNCTGYAYIKRGSAASCFAAPPKASAYNTTTNATTLTFSSARASMMALLLGEKLTSLQAQMVCDEARADNGLHLVGSMSSVVNGHMTIYFQTKSACAVPIGPTEAPGTPAPISGGDDDKKGLTTWEIVGIIAGCVVFVVVVVFVIFQCRRSDTQAEGQYSRV